MRSVLGLTLLSALLPFAVSAREHGPSGRRHHDIAKRASGDVDLHKRDSFTNARLTFYDVGLGACGINNVPSDFIVALNTPQFGGGYPGPNCFKMITIQANGKTTSAQITDECPGCPYAGLDLSRGLFDFFASESVGVLSATWWFNDDSSGGGGAPPATSSPPPPPPPPPTSTWTPDPTPTSTWVAPTTTSTPPPPPPPPTTSSTWSPPPSSSSSVWSSSSAWSSASSSAAWSSSAPASSAEPSASVVPSQAIQDMNQAVMGMLGVIAAGAA